MEIKRIPVGHLNPAAYNPRRNLRPGDPAYEKLERSMQQFGCVEPIVWNQRTGNVVGGHQRLKVLIAAGETELDVSVVDLPLEEEKALNVALNKISGEWDERALSKLLQELSETSVDEILTGFDPGELDRLLADLAPGKGALTAQELDPYVDGFFESGAQPKPPKTQESSAPQQEQEPEIEGGERALEVVVYGLIPEVLGLLTAFLEENGLQYRLEPASV